MNEMTGVIYFVQQTQVGLGFDMFTDRRARHELNCLSEAFEPVKSAHNIAEMILKLYLQSSRNPLPPNL